MERCWLSSHWFGDSGVNGLQHHFNLYLVWLAVGLACSDQSTCLVMPLHTCLFSPEHIIQSALVAQWPTLYLLGARSVTYSYACRNIVNTIITNKTQFFGKIYHSQFIRNGTKRLRKGYVWEVSWRLNKDCNILTPSSSGYSSNFFLILRGCSTGDLRTRFSAWSGSHCFELQQLTPNSDLQLTRTSCSTGLYNCFSSTCFSERHICTQFNPSTVKVIPWYLRPDAPVIYTGAFLIWQVGRVGGQYITEGMEWESIVLKGKDFLTLLDWVIKKTEFDRGSKSCS